MKKLLVAFFVLPLVGHAAATAKPILSELLAHSKSADWRSPDPENLLYLDLESGRVIIELNPVFAPHHVANIKALARENYWDGLAIVRVQENYVVQWADPNADKAGARRKIKQAQATLPAEFERDFDRGLPFTKLPDRDTYAAQTGFINGFAVAKDGRKIWPVHCYGAVGSGRDVAADSGGGRELYAVIGQAPRHLDRNVTLVGRVLKGMELLSALPRGKGSMGFYKKPEQNVTIRSVKVAADLPEEKRTPVQVLRTDTPLFKQVIEARRNRHEEWFLHQAGHADVCNIPIPVR